MHERRIPEWLRHAPTPSVRGFASLSGTEAIARGILVSVFPIEMYRTLGDAVAVSRTYFLIGLLSLAAGLMVPFAARFIARRHIYITGTLLFAGGAITAATQSTLIVPALTAITVATVMLFVCFNAYVLDYIARSELGRCETSRMFYGALGWTVGPVLGVFLLGIWRPLPFLISAAAATAMLGVFLWMRLGNGKLITRSRTPPVNPLSYLPRFFAQPRLVAGWIFAVIRSCGWWVYVVYLPIFAVKSGLGETLGGIALSVSNGMLLVTPLMLRWMQRRSVRYAVRLGFVLGGLSFCAATVFAGTPWVAVLLLFVGSFYLILLDISAGLPFLLAVKPSERTEMSAIYSSFRDVSGIATPGLAWLVLLVAPLSAIFAAGGVALLLTGWLATRLHPRLGQARLKVGPATVARTPEPEPAE
ncbi:MFS transporter [Roseovarius faecimaris]|uniref:MFS transporter n=1 Tax=Roseovarius faecimaris TaxID=2494550 RepID=A0A6I6ILP0_9RHOB|nr:MFS transporter [Roseovarius faecimaris]QGX96994.1 MFS transporter [Roseovarius faecimaris]